MTQCAAFNVRVNKRGEKNRWARGSRTIVMRLTFERMLILVTSELPFKRQSVVPP